MKKLADIQSLLQEPLDMALTESRKGAFNKDLDYMSTFGTKDGLNRIFGNGCWGYNVKELSELDDCRTGKDGSKKGRAYRALVELWAVYEPITEDGWGGRLSVEDVGFGDGSDLNPLKAHELAGKEAVTDGLKRAANGLGYSLGLALYDKSRRFVAGAKSAPKKAKQKPVAKSKVKEKAKPAEDSLDNTFTSMVESKIAAATDKAEISRLHKKILAIAESKPKEFDLLIKVCNTKKKEIENNGK